MRTLNRYAALGSGIAAVLALSLVPPGSAQAGAPAGTQPQAQTMIPYFGDLDALGPDDAWAVGAYYVRDREKLTLAKHWDGKTWTKTETPNPGGKGKNGLYGVSGTASNDVWAVGTYWAGHSGNRGPERLLALHWDGTTWSSVHVEQPDFQGHHHYYAALTNVVALAPDDAWAVGGTTKGSVVEHWDGSAWSIVNASGGGDVAASGPNDVWILAGGNNFLHWDGTSWKSVPGADLGAGAHNLIRFSLAAPSATDAWVAGTYEDANGVWQPVLMHWDGQSWHLQHAPHPPQAWHAVSAASAADAWAVGYTSRYPAEPLGAMDHWDGARWSTVELPRQLRRSELVALTADAPDDAWVLGIRGYGDQARDVLGHWDGRRWHVHD